MIFLLFFLSHYGIFFLLFLIHVIIFFLPLWIHCKCISQTGQEFWWADVSGALTRCLNIDPHTHTLLYTHTPSHSFSHTVILFQGKYILPCQIWHQMCFCSVWNPCPIGSGLIEFYLAFSPFLLVQLWHQTNTDTGMHSMDLECIWSRSFTHSSPTHSP